MRITRLGQRVDSTRLLGPDAIERTIEVLREYRRVMDEAGVRRVRLVATSATRDAANSAIFLERASAVIGAPAEILDGQTEGALAAAGAIQDLAASSGSDVVVDIGGGSTELVTKQSGVVRTVSLGIGCVRITERFLHGDPPVDEELRGAESFIRSAVDGAVSTLFAGGVPQQGSRLIGLAGSVTTLAALELDLADYDPARIHHFRLTRRSVDHWYRVLAAESAAERLTRGAIAAGREDVIVGGVLVLHVVMDSLSFGSCVVSERDILDGLASELLNR
jgi:exopolyphosphatase/guanosine-5'-triphosphate,3'-diphosphate pyrophosphatase